MQFRFASLCWEHYESINICEATELMLMMTGRGRMRGEIIGPISKASGTILGMADSQGWWGPVKGPLHQVPSSR